MVVVGSGAGGAVVAAILAEAGQRVLVLEEGRHVAPSEYSKFTPSQQMRGSSGPTVSQTVARMERDGLLTVEGDRHLELTEEGSKLATRVMRKHRLAERLLIDVIGLEWEDVHAEACRWEHVMSETVERRLLEILDHPTVSPYGNPIPGLAELGEGILGEELPRRGRAARPDRQGRQAARRGRPDRRADPDRRGPDVGAASRRCASGQGHRGGARQRRRAGRQRWRDRRDRRRSGDAPVRSPALTCRRAGYVRR